MGKVQKLSLLFILPAMAALHAAILSALIAINTGWSLHVAEAISFSDPDVAYARAEYYRSIDPEISLQAWVKAASLRPLWPYYQLGALDAEVRLGADDDAIQQRLQKVLDLAPYERGLDAGIFELGLLRWEALSMAQKLIIAKKLNDTNRKTLVFALQVAQQVQKKDLICGIVNPKRTRGLCY